LHKRRSLTRGDLLWSTNSPPFAVIGLATSAVCIGAAAAIGGPAFGEGFGGMFDERPRCQVLTMPPRPAAIWIGMAGQSVTLEIPVQASYLASNGERLHATGDPQILAHIAHQGWRYRTGLPGLARPRQGQCEITLPGQEFASSPSKVGRTRLERPQPSRRRAQSRRIGKIRASGKVDNLKMEIEGSGDADFNQIVARRARVEIEGSGTVRPG
jgi:hypothetical protein